MKYFIPLLLLLPGLALADCATNWMDCTTDSKLQIVSFEMRAKDVIAAITAARTKATQDLEAHKITVVQAKGVLAKTDKARALWEQARTECHANEAGNCQNFAAHSFALLTQAKETLK